MELINQQEIANIRLKAEMCSYIQVKGKNIM